MNKIGISPTSSEKLDKASAKSNGDESKENLFDRRNSNTIAPQENYQEEEKYPMRASSPIIGKYQGKPIQQSRMTKRGKMPSKRGKIASKAKKFVDIEKMLDSDSEEFRPGTANNYGNEERKSENSFDEDRDQVLPLPAKKAYHKASTKKASNIKTKKIRRPNIDQQNTISGISQDNSNSNYDRGFTRSDSVFDNQNFSNIGGPMQQMNINNFGPSFKTNFNSRSKTKNPSKFKEAYNLFNPSAPVLQPEIPETEKKVNLFDSLLYGTTITLNLQDEDENFERKVNTKLRISDKVNATKMDNDEYNIN